MHKYWARKPHNVVSEYILHHSRKGDIVFDPFCGSGVTPIEALKLGRKAIGFDLDPMAIFITKETLEYIDIDKFRKEYKNIESNVKDKINNFYRTKCKKCGSYVNGEAVIWKNTMPKEIRYKCPCSRGVQWKEITDEDLKIIKEIDDYEIKQWYPKNELIPNSRINVKTGERVCDLFTKRNIISLAMILDEIGKIKDDDIRNLLKFTFTSTLGQASKMVFVIRNRGRTRGKGSYALPEVGSWATRGYWIPSEYFEINAWNCFEERFEKVLRGKTESNTEIKESKLADGIEDIKKGGSVFLKVQTALEIEKVLPPNSVDYIFTDPPYGDSVPYLELDYMWSSWIGFKPNFEDEIIISDSPDRGKTEDVYERMMKAAFQQLFRVLKPKKYMTVTFHNTDIKVWNDIIGACIYAGFDLEKIIYQPPARTSAKGLLAPYASAVGDYYIRFSKPEITKGKEQEIFDEERYKRIIVEAAKRIIAERGEPTPYTFILNGIIVELKKEGALLVGKQNPDEVMKTLLNKEFVLVDSKDEKGKIIGKKWWLKNPSSVPYLEVVPLVDRVETAVVEVLRRKVKVSFDDILQEIFIKFPNALTPETQDIKSLLFEYASPTKDGKWVLKPLVKERESEHSEMIYYLAKLGKKAGLGVWIGIREQHEIYNGTKLSGLITDKNPVWRFIPTTNLDRVKQIDVIYHDEGRVKYEFEVENTTAITDAIVRGSNIPHNEINRVIVIPEERESLLYRKMREPIFSEQVNKYGWKFMFYKDIKNAYDKNSNTKETLNLTQIFDNLFRELKEARKRQSSLDTFG
jgi:DNA modification methylase